MYSVSLIVRLGYIYLGWLDSNACFPDSDDVTFTRYVKLQPRCDTFILKIVEGTGIGQSVIQAHVDLY